MNLQTARSLHSGDRIVSTTRKNADGTPMRARITSIKTWKRQPERIEVHYKRGLYEFGFFSETELDQIEVAS